MSKRFGRNQRRKLREEVANLTASRDLHVQRTVRAQAETRELALRLSTWAEDIAHMLGRESAFNEQVMRQQVRDVRSFGGALRMMPPVRLLAPTRGPEEPPQFASVENVIEAAIYLARIDGPPADRMRRQLRIVLESRNGDVAYAMSDDRHRRWSPRDVRYMAEMIALEMARHLVAEGA